ncbi:MAG: ABC transporter ATP-binding protein [Clostridia bacterium]|nr:ABC transporter ATP-binding protein [Clostridia bacterium]
MIVSKNAVKKFDGSVAIDNLSCTIPDGCIYGLVGSNGAGKSTFLRMIAGVYRADAGSVTLDDMPIWENPVAKSQIAYIPDDVFYLPNSTMKRMASLYNAVYPNFDYDTFNYLTKELNLNTQKNLNSFSKGMRRQAATVLGLSAKTKYIYFDETFDGLDPVMRNLVKKLIYNDVAERKATAIITSHSLRELEDICDQLALLHKGGLVVESDLNNLKTKQFKIQIAFAEEYDKSKFESINIVSFHKTGCVTNMIVKGDHEETIAKLSSMNPLILEVLPLSLEEIFTYEMEALGYTFDGIVKEV